MIRLSSSNISILLIFSVFLALSMPRHYLDPLRGRVMQMLGRALPSGHLNDLSSKEESLIKAFELENTQLRERVFDLEQLLAMTQPTSAFLAASVGAHMARVIYRSPGFWDSCCWIRGTPSEKKAFVKNSPVVFGNTLIGIIDLETPDQSRVRLITDPELVVSVRAIRNGLFLAKGELCGSPHPVSRTRGTKLTGAGFHYDFADAEGPARDLRTGQPVGHPDAPAIPLLAIGDILVTTGMDGLFPKGLQVATVVAISALQEGDYFYNLEAESLVSSLDTLTFVSVLPPINAKNSATD